MSQQIWRCKSQSAGGCKTWAFLLHQRRGGSRSEVPLQCRSACTVIMSKAQSLLCQVQPKLRPCTSLTALLERNVGRWLSQRVWACCCVQASTCMQLIKQDGWVA